MTEHPITPPPELVEQWVQATESNDCIGAFPTNFEKRICIAPPLSAAADAVLDAYMANCGWLDGPLEKDYRCAAAVLRAAALYCKRDAAILLSIADELEALPD
jgi:hypothetical protein